ncbi:MAG: geranylgeranylglycerol-phosphate geranylgeranyltransferase [Candidatus Korarchaeota archaeon]|nr:geranylgeranylglycerol-phosphate geranylgeranyltransferase [Candidatus Korarchaeota archaeon]
MGGGNIGGYLRLFRPKNALMSVLGVLVGWVNVSASLGLIPNLILACAVPPFILMAGNAVNDYFDAPIDRVNKPDRPIPSGEVSPREAMTSYIVLSLIGVALSIPLGVEEFVIASLFALSWYLYARWIKAMGLVGNILVSLGVAFTLIFGALAADGLNGKVILFSTIAFTSNLAREVVKTVEDLKGDSLYGLRTVAVVMGPKRAGAYASLMIIVASVLTILPPLAGLTGPVYFLLSVILSIPLLLYSAKESLKIDEIKAKRLSSTLKLSMFLGIMGMLLDPLIR